MTAKEIITQIKDYADCADASYAMLHWVKFKFLLKLFGIEKLIFYGFVRKFRIVFTNGIF